MLPDRVNLLSGNIKPQKTDNSVPMKNIFLYIKSHSFLFIVIAYYLFYYVVNQLLLNHFLFYYYLLFIITGGVILSVFIKNRLKRKSNLLLPRSQLIGAGGFLVIYPFINYVILKTAEWYYFSYFVTVFVLYFGFTVGFYNKLLDSEKIKMALILIAFSEITISFLQYFNLLPHYKYFSVNGTCSNPNFTAMYLVMVLPMAIDFLQQYKNKLFRILSATAIILIFSFTIYLLKSRTAFAGLVIYIIYFFYHYLTAKKIVGRKIIVVGGVLSVIIIGFLIPKFYNLKKESADGRLLVWKVSSHVLAHKPIIGYGYGKTQYVYNIAQAKFFKEQKTTETEKQNAGYISNVLNDYLEISIQGGLIGLFIFSFFLYRLSIASYRRKEKYPYLFIGIVMFIVMLLFNVVIYFTFIAVVLAFYASQITVNSNPKQDIKIPQIFYNGFVVVVSLVLVFISIQAYSQTQLKKAKESLIKGDLIQEKKYLNNSSKCIATSEFFYTISGDAFYFEKDYNSALKKYNIAFKYSANPKLASKMAECYINLNEDKKAYSKLNYAINHTPSLFRPHYLLMWMYYKEGNKQMTIETANIIINKKIKIDSKEVRFYQNKAIEILKSYKNENNK